MNQFFFLDFPRTRRLCLQTLVVARAGLLSFALLLTSCTSARYRTAPKKTPPPALLNLPSTIPPIEALLHTVIIYRGPGSWKQDAYWDEYVVTVANRGNELVVIESASLADFQNQLVAAGKDPWKLEHDSRSFAERGFGFAKNTGVQVGAGFGVVMVGGGVGAFLFSGSGIVAASTGAAVGGLLLFPAFLSATLYTNVNNRHAIEREFERRRLVLPVTLVPGQLVQGSLFFRISPGPKRLILSGYVDDEPREIVIDLAPLAGLHLKAAPAPSTKPSDQPEG